jgi:hypothetical protein
MPQWQQQGINKYVLIKGCMEVKYNKNAKIKITNCPSSGQYL